MIIEFLKNPSFAAFTGAFSAFILVILLDWYRRGSDKNTLRYLVSDTADLSRKKIEQIQLNIIDLNNNGRLSKAGFMPFKSNHLDTLTLKALTKLSANEKQAVDSITYWTIATDEQLDELATTAKSVIDQFIETGQGKKVDDIIDCYRAEASLAIKNMEIIVQYCESYISGKPYEVLESYNVSE